MSLAMRTRLYAARAISALFAAYGFPLRKIEAQGDSLAPTLAPSLRYGLAAILGLILIVACDAPGDTPTATPVPRPTTAPAATSTPPPPTAHTDACADCHTNGPLADCHSGLYTADADDLRGYVCTDCHTNAHADCHTNADLARNGQGSAGRALQLDRQGELAERPQLAERRADRRMARRRHGRQRPRHRAAPLQ